MSEKSGSTNVPQVIVLGQPETDADLVEYRILFDPTNWRRAPEQGAKTVDAVFKLRTFVGADSMKFSNLMLGAKKDGTQQFNTGDVIREKIIRAVEGMEPFKDSQGNPVRRITPAVYALMPQWILNRLTKRINELNEEDEDEEGNS